ncbi:MAG: hypothetical protein AAGF66_09170 [Cyanobacteria bacterium P01_H01_bin.119]
MSLDPAVMKAVEQLDYRVTVADVAAQAGLDIQFAEQGVLALASETQAHLQVSEAGEIAYEFPKNFRGVLQSKYWRLRLQQAWQRVWSVLFYGIRVSFGILLLVSIVLIVVAIAILVIATSSANRQDNNNNRSRGGGGLIFFPMPFRYRYGYGYAMLDVFRPNYYQRRRARRRSGAADDDKLNFLEAIYSFLFGDGDPNADLEEQRWQAIAKVIRNNGGAIAAEQVAPYLDDLGQGWDKEYEDYMLPVLSRFNGRPEVSPEGDIVYHFPELQVMAEERGQVAVGAYLKEKRQPFSEANSGQITIAIGLGAFNLIGALVLGGLLRDQGLVAELGGLVAFVNSIYWLLLAYGTAFLSVPLVRYFWVQRKNAQIEDRNEKRQDRAVALNNMGDVFQRKLSYAQKFISQTVVDKLNLAYTTEKELTQQELEQSDKIDAEWRRRLEGL